MNSTMFRMALLVVGLCVALQAGASIRVVTDAGAIRTQQAQIRTGVEQGSGPYRHLSPQRRSDLYSQQDIVRRVLADGVTDTRQLPEAEQIALFNALESIESIINAADDDRMVCERVTAVGSHRPTKVCKTVAQRRAEREAAQNGIQSCFNQATGKCL